MPMGRPSSSNQLPYDSGHYSFPHMFLQHTVEQDRAPHVLPHYPELARHASRQPPRGHRTDRKHHDENRSQNPLRTRSQPLSQGHQDLRRANGDTQHKARFLPSRMELQHLAQTFERGAIILGRRLCGHDHAWELDTKAWTWECAECHRQTSVTAGTVMHGSKLPLTVWFWASYLMATHSNGISARQMGRQLGLGSYKSAWLLCAKLRRAMVNPARALLSGLVEVDETQISCRTKDDPVAGGQGRDPDGKMQVIAAVEVI